MSKPVREFTAYYRYRPVAGPGPAETFVTITAASMAEARRAAKALEGQDEKTWLKDVWENAEGRERT